MKRTNLHTYEYGRARRVYMDKDGKLYFRANGVVMGTFREYCYANGKELLDLIRKEERAGR